MPCGGIFPAGGHWVEHPCWQCQKMGCDLFCHEWDTPLHSACVRAFLATDEGQCVLGHGHAVIICEDGKEVVLHEER